MNDSLLPAVLAAYPWPGPPQATSVRGGLSSAAVWRVVAGESSFCLRRHPPGYSVERLHHTQQVLAVARRRGCLFVPAGYSTRTGESLVPGGGAWWELTAWMPGQPDDNTQPAPSRVAAAFAALAQFHRATADLGGEVRPAPALGERRERLNEALAEDRRRLLVQAAAVSDWPLLAPLADAAGRVLDRFGAAWREALAQAAQVPRRLQPAIRDVRREHVLFCGDAVTGLVDYGALRSDTPLVDVARLLATYCGASPALFSVACTAYRQTVPLAPEDEPLLPLLARVGELLSALQWLTWLGAEQRVFSDRQAVEHRLSELTARLRQLGE